MLLLLACATVPRPDTFSGTLEPRWWSGAPGYGESAEDPWEPALVLRLDAPLGAADHLIYTPATVDDLVPDASGMACVGGHAEVTGTRTPVLWREASAVLEHARVTSCTPAPPLTPAFGETVTLTGTLRRWWWYMAPGYGADPRTDKQVIGGVVIVNGSPLPIFPTEAGAERHRRFLAACDGQPVTLTGRWEASRSAETKPPYKLVDVVYAGACARPALPGPRADGPVPAAWLE